MSRGLILISMALVLAACGGGGGALSFDPLARAAEKTTKQGSERFRLRMEGGVPTGEYVVITARGVLNNADSSGRAIYVVSGGGESFRARMIFDGSNMYMSSKKLTAKLPDGKSWIKFDEKLLKEVGFGSLDDAEQATPLESLKALRAAGKTREVGKEVVAGVRTTKYHTTVDLEKEKLADEMGVKRMPVDAWVDRTGLIRKMSFSVSPPDPTKAGKVVYVLEGFGRTIRVQAPPSDRTVDFLDLVDE